MSRKIYLLLMALTIIVGCFLQYLICCKTVAVGNVKDTNNVVAAPTPEKEPETTRLPFSVTDANGDLSLTTNDNFNFKTSDFNYETPISGNVDENIVKLKTYLDANKGKSLDVSGFYKATEKNTSMYPNLGMARANSVKNYLTSKGIPSKIINTYGVLKKDIYPDENGIYYGPVKFGIKTAKEGDPAEDYTKLLAEIEANPLVIYFETAKTNVNLNTEQRTKLAKISRYLDKVDTAKCLITGHTDNTGNAQKNIVYGQKRADFAKKYLEKNAISGARIEAISKGQTVPIATNDTQEGKAKNRRTEITIKN